MLRIQDVMIYAHERAVRFDDNTLFVAIFDDGTLLFVDVGMDEDLYARK